MERNNLKHLSTGKPTYWPSDKNKLPDLVDFCVTKGIPQDFAVARSCFDLSSNHSLFLITLTSNALNQEKQPSLSNRHTNWDDFGLQQQSSSSTIQYSGQVGMHHQNIQTH
jgi:hypothetical protein